jgi:hypothetical protein
MKLVETRDVSRLDGAARLSSPKGLWSRSPRQVHPWRGDCEWNPRAFTLVGCHRRRRTSDDLADEANAMANGDVPRSHYFGGCSPGEFAHSSM